MVGAAYPPNWGRRLGLGLGGVGVPVFFLRDANPIELALNFASSENKESTPVGVGPRLAPRLESGA